MIPTTARAVKALAAAAALTLGGCATNPETGASEVDAVAVLEVLSLTASVLALVTGDADDPPPDLIALAANGAAEGIAKFCRLDAWDKATVRRQLDARDPTLRLYLIDRYGGPDGDVCTAE